MDITAATQVALSSEWTVHYVGGEADTHTMELPDLIKWVIEQNDCSPEPQYFIGRITHSPTGTQVWSLWTHLLNLPELARAEFIYNMGRLG